MTAINRRQALRAIGAAAPLLLANTEPSRAGATAKEGMTLGFSTYGMGTLKTEQALDEIARIGFDSAELTVWPDWNAAPGNMPPTRRGAIRRQLDSTGLKLTSLMEHLDIGAAKPPSRPATLERLKAVAELAHDLAPDAPPLIQTILGGKEWEPLKSRFLDYLGAWAELAERTDTTIAFKPHRGSAMDRPEQGRWVIEQLGRPPRLRIAYDYSHFAHRDMTIAGSIDAAMPYIAHVAVKDVVMDGEKARFLLAGESQTIDYVKMLKILDEKGYRGDINCEVSRMVSQQPGYDGVAAARTCYANLAAAFDRAGVRRA